MSCKKSFWLAPLSDGKVSCFQAYCIMVAVPFYADVAVVDDMAATSHNMHILCTDDVTVLLPGTASRKFDAPDA